VWERDDDRVAAHSKLLLSSLEMAGVVT